MSSWFGPVETSEVRKGSNMTTMIDITARTVRNGQEGASLHFNDLWFINYLNFSTKSFTLIPQTGLIV